MPDLHQQMSDLSARIAELEQQLGEICGEYVEVTAALTPFLGRYHNEVLRYHRALVMAQRERADVRAFLGDASAMSRGEAMSPLDLVLQRTPPSVQDQYERIWKGKEGLRLAAIETGYGPATPALKTLYAKAVARLYPDLARTAEERRSCVRLFNQVNAAYLRRDEQAIGLLADTAAAHGNLPMMVTEQVVEELNDRTYILEELIHRIEGQQYEWRYGDTARLRALVVYAEREGRDLLAELSADLQRLLRNTVEELGQLKSRLDQAQLNNGLDGEAAY